MQKCACVSAVLCVVVAFLVGAGQCLAAPKVTIDTGVFELGTVSEGEAAVHGFLVKNTGDAPLLIKPRPC